MHFHCERGLFWHQLRHRLLWWRLSIRSGQSVVHFDSMKLTVADANACWLHGSLLYHRWVCCGELCRPELLFEKRSQSRFCKVSSFVLSVLVSTNIDSADVISVTVTSRKTAVASAQTCPSSYSCPANNGCTFQGADSRPFTLSCGVDFNGGDRSNINVDSFESCTQACADSSWCVAASYVGGSGAGVCYLKDQLNAGVTNNNVDGMCCFDNHRFSR